MERKRKRKWWEGRGFYIALALCALVIGTTTYLAVEDVLSAGEDALPGESGGEDGAPAGSGPIEGIPADPQEALGNRTEQDPEPEPEPEPEPMRGPEPEPEPASATAAPPADPPETEAETLETMNVLRPAAITQLPTDGGVLRPFSADELVWSPSMADWRTHEGVDLAGGADGAVVAPGDGTVEAVLVDPLFGVTVVIRHNEDTVTRCSSLAEETVAVAAGDFVTAGTPLGTVGQTAACECLDEAHVHFELLIRDEPADPVGYLS